MCLQKIYFSVVLSLVCLHNLVAQDDCILGVGVTANEAIISVFQLNKEQVEKITNFANELKDRSELMAKQLENRTKNHPQSSKEDLMKLAGEYKTMIDSLGGVQKMIDIKMLSLFNIKQYDRYINLCEEAFRRPLYIIPVNYSDSQIDSE